MRHGSDMRRAGFSLIELLVVMGIIAVLAALMLGGVRTVKAVANGQVCAANLRQIGLAFAGYAEDNLGMYPAPKAASAYPGIFYREWYGPIASYLDRDDPTTYSSGGKIFRCPDGNFRAQNNDFGLSYGYCLGTGGTSIITALANPVQPSRLGRPQAATFLLGERWAVNVADLNADWSPTVEPPYKFAPVLPPKRPGCQPSSLRLSHSGKSAYLFVDLHVEIVGPWDRVNRANTGTWAGSRVAPNAWQGMP